MSSTSPSGYAFVDCNLIVVQAIGGSLNDAQLAQFERDYKVLFGSEFSVPAYEGTTVWIGGRYNPDDGTFSPPELPAQPDSQPEEIVP